MTTTHTVAGRSASVRVQHDRVLVSDTACSRKRSCRGHKWLGRGPMRTSPECVVITDEVVMKCLLTADEVARRSAVSTADDSHLRGATTSTAEARGL